MRITIGMITLAGLLAAATATAQTTVYKCTGADGAVVFSGQPCKGSNKEVLHLEDAGTRDVAEVERRRQVQADMAEQNRQLELARQEQACIENRTAATRRGTEDRIESLSRRIRALRYRSGYANNNLAGATWESGLREEIAGLEQSISTEKQILAQTVVNARSICAERRAVASEPAKQPEDTGMPSP